MRAMLPSANAVALRGWAVQPIKHAVAAAWPVGVSLALVGAFAAARWGWAVQPTKHALTAA
eukprot:1149518-Pelagomonas_calceolata.AAC.6